MTTPKRLLDRAIVPALNYLSTIAPIQVDAKALILVVAIAGQESDWRARRQIGGPARSYWQFEKGGGVAGLFGFPRARDWLSITCMNLDIFYDPTTVFEAMAWNDTLAATMARLLLWTDPRALPEVGQEQAAWHYYLDNWRPGLPHLETWPGRYKTAMETVTAQGTGTG